MGPLICPRTRRNAGALPVRNGTGKVELRTRVESNETELVLVPADGTELLWLTRTGGD
jgi:hypothetical protein